MTGLAGRRSPVFFTLVCSRWQKACARIMIDSLRAFGGPLVDSRVLVFQADHAGVDCEDLKGGDTEVARLSVDRSLDDFAFSEKVCACAKAEELMADAGRSIVWMASDTLVVQPPSLFDLDASFDVAVRPVHIRNIGALAGDVPDAFWKGVYGAAGIDDVPMHFETFVDRQSVKAYFNSHSYAVNPSKGLFGEWLRVFRKLVKDKDYLQESCGDELHQVFLHQATLSAVTVKLVPADRLRLLPPTYSYPYNLHASVPAPHRAKVLNDLVTVVYEDRLPELGRSGDIEVREPLRSWLSTRTGAVR